MDSNRPGRQLAVYTPGETQGILVVDMAHMGRSGDVPAHHNQLERGANVRWPIRASSTPTPGITLALCGLISHVRSPTLYVGHTRD